MAILRDILDAIKGIKDMGDDTIDDIIGRKSYSSIARRSMEGILQFPCIVSKSIDIESLQMVTKALERQYASFVQISITMAPTLDLSKDKDAIKFLRSFHQNTNVRTSISDITTNIKNIIESYSCVTNEDETIALLHVVAEGSTPYIIKLNKEQLTDVLDGINEEILNNKFTPSAMYESHNPYIKAYQYEIMLEKGNGRGKPRGNGGGKFRGNGKNSGNQNRNYSNKTGAFNNITNAKNITSKIKNVKSTNIYKNNEKKDDKETSYTAFELPRNILRDNDVRKSNELVPTTLQIRVFVVDKDKTQGHMDFIIGVKSTMHPVDSEDVINNLISGVKNKSNFFNFIRWRTGEISFFKDFVFMISEIKEDALRSSKGSSMWWNVLKRRRTLSNITKFLPNKIMPNTTIVISMDEVNFIKSEYGYDFMSVTFVDKIMQHYFLLGFVVVDTSLEVAHFLFDGQYDFQSLTFSGLERDMKSSNSLDFRDVLKLVQRV